MGGIRAEGRNYGSLQLPWTSADFRDACVRFRRSTISTGVGDFAIVIDLAREIWRAEEYFMSRNRGIYPSSCVGREPLES